MTYPCFSDRLSPGSGEEAEKRRDSSHEACPTSISPPSKSSCLAGRYDETVVSHGTT